MPEKEKNIEKNSIDEIKRHMSIFIEHIDKKIDAFGEQVVSMKQDINLLKSGFSNMEIKMERIEVLATQNRADIKKLQSGQERMENDIEELKTDVSILKTDVSILKTDVSELKTDVSILKTDVSILKTDVSELKTDVSELKSGQNRIEKKIKHSTENHEQRISRLEAKVS